MPRFNGRFHTALLTTGILLLAGDPAAGQIEKLGEWAGQEMIQLDIPARIIMSPDGEPEVFFARWGPVPQSQWRESDWLSRSVPVFTQDPNGVLWIGGLPQNTNNTETGILHWNEPVALIEQEDGSFVLEKRDRMFSTISNDPFPAGYRATKTTIDSVPIVFLNDDNSRSIVPPELDALKIELTARPDVVFTNVPLWAELDLQAGKSRVVIGQTADRARARPEMAPCFVKDFDGSWLSGGYQENKSGHSAPMRSFHGHWGVSIRQAPTGEFQLRKGEGWSTSPLHGPEATYPPGARRFMVDTAHLRLHYFTKSPTQQQSRLNNRGLTGPVAFLPIFKPNNWVTHPDERASFLRGMIRWASIINTNVTIIFDVIWDENGGQLGGAGGNDALAEL